MPAKNAAVCCVCNSYSAVEIIIVTLHYINVRLTLTLQHIGEPVIGCDASVVEPVADSCRCGVHVSPLRHPRNQLPRCKFVPTFYTFTTVRVMPEAFRSRAVCVSVSASVIMY